MINFRRIKRNAKALSPVIASIILIAVTVAVSVVVAAWMGGMSLGLMGNAEQASITSVQLSNNAGNGIAVVTIQNTGANTVTINSANIGGSAVTSNQTLPWSVPKGTIGTIQLTWTGTTFVSSAQYVINLVTGKGNTVTYTATYSGP